MCGISAIIGLDRPIDVRALVAMNGEVRHRGPDDEGYALFRGVQWTPLAAAGLDTPPNVPLLSRAPLDGMADAWVGLGHRRLSIVDLSAAGHQPMADAAGARWITYNGEIYNYLELRDELTHLGHRFHSASDTEVLLAAYAQWGSECLARLNGMFAFVIVDQARRQVFAARDRFGVKPLYYWVSPAGFLAIASEIKQFTVLPGWRALLNGPRAKDFLAFGLLDHTDETLFAGVRQLRGGEFFVVDADAPLTCTPRRWYTLAPRGGHSTFVDAAEALRAALVDSVRIRLRADVPVGSCLSGGLDSSSIVMIANDLLRGHAAAALQRTFSARAEDSRLDEGHHIAAVAERLSVANAQVTPALEPLFELLPRLTWHQDEPFGSSSIYAQWLVFALASREGVRVVLDGQGADELLAGYHGFLGARFADLLFRGRLVALLDEFVSTRRTLGLPLGRLLQYLASAALPTSIAARLRQRVGRPSGIDEHWLDLGKLGAGGTDRGTAPIARQRGIAAMSRAQLLDGGLPMLLHWEDRDSMAHSVEARLPFLDYRLVELALGFPDEFKLARGVTKRVLRAAMHTDLPPQVRDRRDKIGFATSESLWLRAAAPRFRALLARGIDSSGGVLRASALDIFDATVRGDRAFDFLPWRMISFGAWMERFAVSPS